MEQPSQMSATKITATTPPTKMTYTQFKILSIDLQSHSVPFGARMLSHSFPFCARSFACLLFSLRPHSHSIDPALLCANGNVLFLGSIGPKLGKCVIWWHRQNNKNVCEEPGYWVALAPSGQSIGHKIRAAYRAMCEVNELPAAIDEKLQLLVWMCVYVWFIVGYWVRACKRKCVVNSKINGLRNWFCCPNTQKCENWNRIDD